MKGSGGWEQLALESIEAELGGSDPALASLLAIFSRLAMAEDMPARERIRFPLRHPPRRRRRRPVRTPRPRSAPLAWLVVAVVLITVAVILSRGGTSGCAPAWGMGCAG
jgi:hypothetical protein